MGALGLSYLGVANLELMVTIEVLVLWGCLWRFSGKRVLILVSTFFRSLAWEFGIRYLKKSDGLGISKDFGWKIVNFNFLLGAKRGLIGEGEEMPFWAFNC